MEKSGITRRIDELGRIVIPKEIRKNLKINSSDELEIKIINGNLVLSKMESLETDRVITNLVFAINKETKKNILITSKDNIIDGKINDRNIHDLLLSDYALKIINKRQSVSGFKDNVNLFNKEEELSYVIEPLIINGDLVGSIILYSEENIESKDKEIIAFCKRFLENYLE